jgi:hypothetical protein
VVRACITSFNTTEEDIHWVVGEMNRLAATEIATSIRDVEQYVTQAR